MLRKNVDSYSPGKIKNRFPRNRCVKFLDSPPFRYRSEAPVCFRRSNVSATSVFLFQTLLFEERTLNAQTATLAPNVLPFGRLGFFLRTTAFGTEKRK
ncbi:hypothetical protein DPMN_031975 [Dreissena polymorpha]|uniref:Uncharacterized protein n=1 Tax=Dreissena polymorpha TaxID=45954 RepID=A0A9D4M3B7_DREPO|nr:hypothetical protein DPMN_031975 [Dreissena polymorpha]